MGISMEAANALESAIDGKIAKAAAKSTRANGTVTRIGKDGTPFVRLDGSDTDTPAARAAAAVRVGEHVGVTVSGGSMAIDGNWSAPATDDTAANAAQSTADAAIRDAGVAASAAAAAVQSAEVAEQAAQDAQDSLQSVVQGATTVEKAVSVMQTALEAVVDYDPSTDTTTEYFWHDANGAHVLGDTSGYRNDIDSSGMDIKQVSTEDSVAHFGADGSRIGKGDAAHLETSDTYFNIVSDAQTTLVFAGIPDNPATATTDSQIIYTADAQIYAGEYPGYDPPEGTMQAAVESYGYKLDRKPVDGSMSSIIHITAWTSHSVRPIDITDVAWWLASGTVNGISSWWLSTGTDLANEYGVEYIDVYYTGIDIVPVYVMGMPTVGIDGLGRYSMSEGYRSNAIGSFSHAEGKETEASGLGSHSEGVETKASGGSSHAEGSRSTASNAFSHAEGAETKAKGAASHAEGYSTTALLSSSHAEGYQTEATQYYAHSEGNGTVASARQSHAQNLGTVAASLSQTALGRYNVPDAQTDTFTGDGSTTSFTLTHSPEKINSVIIDGERYEGGRSLSGNMLTLEEAPALGSTVKVEYGLDTYAAIIGNGTADSARKNALAVDWDGIPYHRNPSDTWGSVFDLIYPVGSIYMSVNSTDPGTLFGGTWQRISGRFLLAATDNGAAGGNSNASIAPGYTGGEATHKLTSGESGVPAHSHPLQMNIAQDVATGTAKYSPRNNATGHSTTMGTVQNNTAADAASAHNNMPPYLAVYVWKRTA